MKTQLTNLQLKCAHKISRMDVLTELNKRGALKRDHEIRNEFIRLEKGQLGEQTLLECIKKLGKDHWIVLRNVWLNHFGKFECDLILVTNAGIYIFEVKNYSGRFELSKSQCSLNGEVIGQNPITQTQKITNNLRALLKDFYPRPNIRGILTFASVNNKVIFHDEISGVSAIDRTEINDCLWKIAQEDYNYRGNAVKVQPILDFLEEFEVENPYQPNEKLLELSKDAKKGIHCCHCGNFEIETNKSYVTCSCGMHEPREESIIRTICEFGVLNFDKDFTTSALTDFFDGDVSRRSILRCLNKYFKKIGENRSTRYKNVGSFEKNYTDFKLESSKYYSFNHINLLR